MRADEAPVVVEESFDVSVETVWRAITEIDQMRQWYFENIPSFKPEVGFQTRFDVQCEDRDFLHIWTVTEVVPRKRIKYDWQYEGHPGEAFVVFELSEQDDRTTLTLTNEVRQSFPDDIPEFQRESCADGWTYLIKQRLKDFLATRS